MYPSYTGLAMTGYQGCFNAVGDEANVGFRHYNGAEGFKMGGQQEGIMSIHRFAQCFPAEPAKV